MINAKENMNTLILEKGTIIKVNGLPYELVEDIKVKGNTSVND